MIGNGNGFQLKLTAQAVLEADAVSVTAGDMFMVMMAMTVVSLVTKNVQPVMEKAQ